MPYKNLSEFINVLEAAGELKRIAAEVDPKLEITEIADRISKTGGPALLFENVRGAQFPLLINAYGSYRRMQMALHCASFDDIAGRLESLLKTQPPKGILDKIKMLLTLKDIAALMPKNVSSAPCQEKVYTGGPLLDMLPILTCWPGDGGPFITLPVVITKDPETGVQTPACTAKFDGRRPACTGNRIRTARHYHKYKKLGRPMDVAVALGAYRR